MSKYLALNTEKFQKHLWLIFSVIVILNILLKIIYLDFSPFWYDEIISVKSASEDFGHIKHVSEWDKNPPFYYYCLSVWIKLFNDSEFVVRFLSVLFSSFSAGVLFLFANKHFNKTTAIITSILFLSSEIIFFYSHEARAYSLVLLLILISTSIFFNFKDNPSTKNLILLGLFNFLIIYTHYIAGLIIIFQTIISFIYFEKPQKKFYFLSLIIVIGLTLLRYTKKQAALILAFNSHQNIFWLKHSQFSDLITTLESFLFCKALIIPLLLIMVFGLLMVFRLKLRTMSFTFIYTLSMAWLSILVVFFLGKITPVFLDRYLIYSIPFLFLLIAYPLSLISIPSIPILLTLAFGAFLIKHFDYKTDKGMDYKGVTFFIKTIKNMDDLVIVKTRDMKPLFSFYYDRDYFSSQKKDLSPEENIIFCSSWNEINRDLKKFKRIIVIDTFENLNPEENDFVLKVSKVKKKYATVKYYKGAKMTFYK